MRATFLLKYTFLDMLTLLLVQFGELLGCVKGKLKFKSGSGRVYVITAAVSSCCFLTATIHRNISSFIPLIFLRNFYFILQVQIFFLHKANINDLVTYNTKLLRE